jgi:two-component system sensor histidine kinase/response regulator
MRPQRSSDRSFDVSAALEMTGGDTELLKELADLFLEEYPKLLGSLRAAIEEKSAKKIEMAAHKLKGSTSGFGAKVAVEKAFGMEKLGRQGDVEGAEKALRELEEAFEPLLGELEDWKPGA